MIVANLYGTPAKLEEIQEICKKHHAVLIEDAAESLGATYKDWDFSMSMNGVLGQEILSYSAMRLSNMFASDDQTTVNVLKESYDAAFRNGEGSLPRLSLLDKNGNRRVSDAYVKDGDFFRVSNLQVGYTLPKEISKKLSILLYFFLLSFNTTNYVPNS